MPMARRWPQRFASVLQAYKGEYVYMKIAEALEVFSQTHPGMVRSHNEDSVACDPACGLVVLADGMGG